MKTDPKIPKILIAEDRRDQAILVKSLIEDMLGKENVEIRWAKNTEEGHHRMQTQGFDLLITDGWMPREGDGIRLATLAKEIDPDMPIIMLTSLPPVSGAEMMDIVLRKSPDLSSLEHHVLKFLNKG